MTLNSYSSKRTSVAQQIFTGTTWHVRRLPSQHKFSYPYRYWGLNITALAAGNKLPQLGRMFSTEHQGAKKTILQQLCFDDYLSHAETGAHSSEQERKTLSMLDGSAQALLQRLNAQFAALTGSQPEGEILALVVGRNLGLYFSPVNFYIGFDEQQSPSHLLAEVSNTPWDKRHYYGFLLAGASSSVSHAKDFHVSPFNPIDQRYRWQVDITSAHPNAPLQSKFDVQASANTTAKDLESNFEVDQRDCLDISIAIHVSDERGEVFAAGVNLRGEPMTQESIKSALRANPIMSITSVAQIYWHALKLFAIKRIPYIHYDQTLQQSKQAVSAASSGLDSHANPNNPNNPNSTLTNHSDSQDSQDNHSINLSSVPPLKGDPMSTQRESSDIINAQMPTDRRDLSKLDKVTSRLTKSMSDSKLLKPVDSGINKAARTMVRKALTNIKFGQLIVIEDYTKKTNSEAFGSLTDVSEQKSVSKGSSAIDDKNMYNRSSMAGQHPLKVSIIIHDISVYRQLLFGGSIALADSYINGQWDTDDLTGLIRLAARNIKVLDKLEGRFAGINKAIERTKHRLRSNDKLTAKSNILAHYDLGNAMYEQFLDPSMMYSSAVYPEPNSNLAEAQQHKLKLICEQLALTAQDQVVEIGTGWGGFAIYAASHYGCHVTTTTISDAQFDEAKRRIHEAGLDDKITLLKKDYRELEGQFDKLVSIEMIEAVGHEYLPQFFSKCNELLKPTGRMVLQAITFNDQGYEEYLDSVDFIQTHIFPGGCLLSNQEIIHRFTEQTDMVVKQLIDYGYDYARTLRDWREAFFAHQDAIKALGYDEAFMRLWRFYFCYCEGGFLERSIGVVQVMAVKPDDR